MISKFEISLSAQVGKGGIVKDPVVHQEVGSFWLSELFVNFIQYITRRKWTI